MKVFEHNINTIKKEFYWSFIWTFQFAMDLAQLTIDLIRNILHDLAVVIFCATFLLFYI